MQTFFRNSACDLWASDQGMSFYASAAPPDMDMLGFSLYGLALSRNSECSQILAKGNK